MRPPALRTSADFRRVLHHGRRRRRGGVTVVSHPAPVPGPRIGLVVGKTVGGAVERNRVKRRLRGAFREIQWEQGMDYVILADRRVSEVPFPVLTGWLAAAVRGHE